VFIQSLKRSAFEAYYIIKMLLGVVHFLGPNTPPDCTSLHHCVSSSHTQHAWNKNMMLLDIAH